jgi:RNA polymerase sigma factor (TIGR02999 family)
MGGKTEPSSVYWNQIPNMPDDLSQLTALLNRMSGSQGVQERVFRLVYAELRGIAQRLVSQEADGNVYQATELLHDTYLKKLRSLDAPIRSRQHFYSLAARAMRQVLIEEARRRRADKRQAPVYTAAPVVAVGSGFRNPDELLDVAPLLERLQEIDARAASVVDLRYFLGCSLEETADVLGATVRAVRDDWDFARLWLQKQLEG